MRVWAARLPPLLRHLPGAVYVSLFPGRADRIVLDSAVDPRLVWRDMLRTWNEAVALRLPDFLTFAAERDAVYHLGATPDEVRRTYDRLTAALDERPVPNLGGPEFDGNVLREVTRSLLYFDFALPSLAEFWQALAAAVSMGSAVDTAAVARLARLGSAGGVTAGDGAGTAEVPVDNHVAALYTVVCNDVAWPGSVALHARQVAADRRAWPVTAGMPSNIWPCAAWPTRPVEPPVTVTGNGPRNVLILQNTRDPATSLRSALGRRVAMVTVDQGGHGVFGLGSCADEATNTFLATGALPARDRFCPAPSPAGDTVRSAAVPYIPPAWPL